jgi:uncharacterized protein YbjQ (UPF0145 family)
MEHHHLPESDLEARVRTGQAVRALVVMVASLFVAFVATAGLLLYTVHRLNDAVASVRGEADTTECFRRYTNDLSDARWRAVARLLDASRRKDNAAVIAATNELRSLTTGGKSQPNQCPVIQGAFP